jgi:hypothetical protein
MNRNGCFSIATACQLLCAVGAIAVWGAPAHAIVVNKYTFNNKTAADAVGGMNGTVIDNTAISRYTGGAIDLSANNGANSDQDFANPATIGAYVDLQNGVFTSAVSGGTFGAVTLEAWATPQENRNWARLADFGTSDAGENSSAGAGNSSYVIITPQNGLGGANDHNVTASTHTNNSDPTPDEVFLFGGPALAPNVKHHVVFTLDQTDFSAGTNGTAKLYIDNAAPVVQPIVDNLLLETISDNNNWLGRAQWPDPLFDGLIDEFRIYNHALSAAEVTASFNAGPDPALLPVLVVNRATGAITLDNDSAVAVQLKGYTITSGAGSLNPATWTSIDAGNTFDPDGTWTNQSSTSFNLAESVTGGTLDGGTLAPLASQGIGTPWQRTPFEDLEFTFTLGDSTTGFGEIQYIGAPRGRSDLNGDGSVNTADWALFLPNTFTNFPSETPVGAYLKGDLDGDLDNDYADFRLFKADFAAVNGAAAAAQLSLGNIPEPSALCLVTILVLASLRTRRRR